MSETASKASAPRFLATRSYDRLVYVSGQVPRENGEVKYIGQLGGTVSVEDGVAAARLCALNIVEQLRKAVGGDLSKVQACLRVRGFVNASPDFKQHAAVINGASDLLVEVLGEAGRHARTAIGVSSLPHGCAVEVDADFVLVEGAV